MSPWPESRALEAELGPESAGPRPAPTARHQLRWTARAAQSWTSPQAQLSAQVSPRRTRLAPYGSPVFTPADRRPHPWWLQRKCDPWEDTCYGEGRHLGPSETTPAAAQGLGTGLQHSPGQEEAQPRGRCSGPRRASQPRPVRPRVLTSPRATLRGSRFVGGRWGREGHPQALHGAGRRAGVPFVCLQQPLTKLQAREDSGTTRWSLLLLFFLLLPLGPPPLPAPRLPCLAREHPQCLAERGAPTVRGCPRSTRGTCLNWEHPRCLPASGAPRASGGWTPSPRKGLYPDALRSRCRGSTGRWRTRGRGRVTGWQQPLPWGPHDTNAGASPPPGVGAQQVLNGRQPVLRGGEPALLGPATGPGSLRGPLYLDQSARPSEQQGSCWRWCGYQRQLLAPSVRPAQRRS